VLDAPIVHPLFKIAGVLVFGYTAMFVFRGFAFVVVVAALVAVVWIVSSWVRRILLLRRTIRA